MYYFALHNLYLGLTTLCLTSVHKSPEQYRLTIRNQGYYYLPKNESKQGRDGINEWSRKKGYKAKGLYAV